MKLKFRKILLIILTFSIIGSIFLSFVNNDIYAEDTESEPTPTPVIFSTCTEENEGVQYCGVPNNNDPNFSTKEKGDTGALLETAFDFTLSTALVDLTTLEGIQKFLGIGQTFIVIKNTEGNQEIFFNTPNLSQLMKNLVLQNLTDGYSNSAYKVSDTKWIVDVSDEDPGNLMEKYGFNIPSNTYNGEYPVIILSLHQLVPEGWLHKIWKGVKSLFFGMSFLEAPSTTFYNTIRYRNHTYDSSGNAQIVEYLIDNWQEYFINYLITSDENYAGTVGGKVWGESGSATIQDKTFGTDISDWLTNTESLSNIHDTTESVMNGNDMSGTSTYINKLNTEGVTTTITSKTFKNGKDLLDSLTTVDSFTSSAEARVEIDDDLAYIEEQITKRDEEIEEWIEKSKSIWNNSMEEAKRNKLGYEGISENEFYEGSDLIKEVIQEAKKIAAEKRKELGPKPKKWLIELEEDFPDEYNKYLSIMAKKEQSEEVINNFVTFRAKWQAMPSNYTGAYNYTNNLNEGDGIIQWSQCFIKLTDDDTKIFNKDENSELLQEAFGKDEVTLEDLNKSCLVMRNGEKDPVRLSGIEVIAQSGLWEITASENEEDPTNTKINRDQAWDILQRLQNTAGPYYQEVIFNILTIMRMNGAEPLKEVVNDRTMPYINYQIVNPDQNALTVNDPRTANNWISSLLQFNSNGVLGLLKLPNKITEMIIGITGRLSELTVYLNGIISFDTLDSIGLSPAMLWKSAFVTLLVSLILIFTLIRFAILAFRFLKGRGALMEAIKAFIVAAFAVGVLLGIGANPEGSWADIKSTLNQLANFGESSITMNVDSYKQLHTAGDKRDDNIVYWIPYFDLWTYYNTGYSVVDKAAKIEYTTAQTNTNKSEYKGDSFEGAIPEVGSDKVYLWPVMLADSFLYNDVTTNNIKDSAYRVVDHYMAPRVSVEGEIGSQTIITTTNENYNGLYQSGVTIFASVGHLLVMLLLLLIVIVKLLTFLWWWWKLCLFLFDVMLSFSNSKEASDIKTVLKNLLIPILQMFAIGAWAGMVIWINSCAGGVESLLVAIILIFLSVTLFRLWFERYQSSFPMTLRPIRILFDTIGTKLGGKHAH